MNHDVGIVDATWCIVLSQSGILLHLVNVFFPQHGEFVEGM
jgi:hypothetical protein